MGGAELAQLSRGKQVAGTLSLFHLPTLTASHGRLCKRERKRERERRERKIGTVRLTGKEGRGRSKWERDAHKHFLNTYNYCSTLQADSYPCIYRQCNMEVECKEHNMNTVYQGCPGERRSIVHIS